MLQKFLKGSYIIHLRELLLQYNIFFDTKSVLIFAPKLHFILMELQMWVVKIRMFLVWEDLQVTTLALSAVCLIPDRAL